jgi:hypothetical protein
MKLSNGPASVMTLSPPVPMIRTGTGFRSGPLMVHPDVSAAIRTSVSTGAPPRSSVERIFQVPAISSNESVPRSAIPSSIAMVSLAVPAPTDRSSGLPQLAMTAAQTRMGMYRILASG